MRHSVFVTRFTRTVMLCFDRTDSYFESAFTSDLRLSLVFIFSIL